MEFPTKISRNGIVRKENEVTRKPIDAAKWNGKADSPGKARLHFDSRPQTTAEESKMKKTLMFPSLLSTPQFIRARCSRPTAVYAIFLLLLSTGLFAVAQETRARVGLPSGELRRPIGWQAIGPDSIQSPNFLPAAGKLQALVVDNQNSAVMYAAGGIGPGNSGPYTEAGIYKTVNGGSTWTQSNVGLTDHVVDALWLNQGNPNTILAGTNTSGIFRTTDGGAHWILQGAFGATTAFLQVAATLYAATAQGIAKSTDNGTTWTIYKATSAPVRALAVSGSTLYAGLDNGQVLIQLGGIFWKATTPASRTVWSIATNPTNPSNAFVVEWNGYQLPDLYVTNNAGNTWTAVTNLNCPAQVIAYDSTTTALYTGCDGSMYQSFDNGNSWTQLQGTPWDVRLIVTDFANASGNIAVGSDQGIYLSKNGGATWQGLNGNITSSILFGLAVQGSTILTTVQDFSPISSFDAGKTWSNLESGAAVGEAGTVIFNPGKPQFAYIFTTSGFYYSTDSGKTFTFNTELASNEFPQSAGNGDLIVVDAKNPSTVYVAAVDGVFKSVDSGVSWVLQSWPVSGPVMVGVDPTDGSNIFVGEQSGALIASHDGGATWMKSNLSCTNCGSPTSLAVDPNNSRNVLIGMSTPPPNGGILVSTDGGANFTLANSGIAVRTTQCQASAIPHVRFDPSGSGRMAAATNSGLYISSTLGGSWSSIRLNAVPYAFTDLVWSGGDLYASTCGEGVLRMPFSESSLK